MNIITKSIFSIVAALAVASSFFSVITVTICMGLAIMSTPSMAAQNNDITINPVLPKTIERVVVVKALRNAAQRIQLFAIINCNPTTRKPDAIAMARAEALYQAADVAEQIGFLEEGIPVKAQEQLEEVALKNVATKGTDVNVER
jgi:hypothetical protein